MAITVEPTDRGHVLPGGPRSQRRTRSLPRRVLSGRPDDGAWVRPALIALLGLTAVLYLWGLGRSGWANTFYSGAVQAGTKSWKAFFFGSSDAANFITVDKPPAALWVMELSARIFGLRPWSILVPQAIEGVAAVGVLYATLRRWVPAGAALLGGAALALTPAAALMFRYNNPDALLVLLLTGAAYATVRAVESGRTRWLVLAGVLVGGGFLAKMLQAFVIVPALAGVYLLVGPGRWRRRVWQLALSGAAMFAAAGWWVMAVELTPAADRPYIGGSQDNSLWNLIFGYNGFGRLTGSEAGSVGGGQTGTSGRWGATGLTRLLNAEFGAQASWLLPAAGILLFAGLYWTLRRPRLDRARAGLLLWGGWTALTGAVLSFGQGIIHPYYTVALAPGIAGLVAVGSALAWSRRHQLTTRVVIASALLIDAWWAWVLLDRDPTWHPALRVVIAGAASTSAIAIIAGPSLIRSARVLSAVACLGAASSLAGPAAYSLQTASVSHSGAIPSAGPATTGGPGRSARHIGGFGFSGPGGGGPGGFGPGGGNGGGGASPPGGAGSPGTGSGSPATGGFQPPSGSASFGAGGNQGGRLMPSGGPGGILGGVSVSSSTVNALKAGSVSYRWIAATVGSEQAAAYQLATGEPVMAIGGFNGTDPAPSLSEFQRDVKLGRIHWFIGGQTAGGSQQTSTVASQIEAWVASHYQERTVGGIQAYDLTSPVE